MYGTITTQNHQRRYIPPFGGAWGGGGVDVGWSGDACFIMTISELTRLINAEVANIEQIQADILNELEDDIIEMQKERLEQGLFVSGYPIYPFYSDWTVMEKEYKGQPSDRVTLKDTGDFYSGIYAAQFGDEILISSHDDKTPELEEKYSENLFGITNSDFGIKNNSDDLKAKSTDLLIIRIKNNTKLP